MSWRRPFRIIVVDDSSPDGTGEAARILGERLNLTMTVLNRQPPRSLGAAIVDGMARTDSNLLCVMDADLSHPPSLLPAMVERLDGLEGVVASRYAPGGQIVAWPAHRRVMSYVATALTRCVLGDTSTDPLSGFFILRRDAIQGVQITGLGNKPLMELLSRTKLLLQDVPYEFRDRRNGMSKLSVQGIVDFIHLLAVAVRLSRSRGHFRTRATEQRSPVRGH